MSSWYDNPLTTDPEGEMLRVKLNKVKELVRADVPEEIAEKFWADIDIGLFRKLDAQGCPPGTAVRIAMTV